MSIVVSKRLTRAIWYAAPLTLSTAFAWKSRIKILRVINPAGAGQISFDPAKPANSLTTLNTGDVFELDALGITAGNASTFFTLDNGLPTNSNPAPPTATSLSASTVAVGDTLNVTGTNYANVFAVVVGNVLLAPVSGSATSTNVAAVVTSAVGVATGQPVRVLTMAGGVSNALAVNVTAPSGNKLATPVVTAGTPTASSVPFSWPAIAGADSYQISINSGAIVSTSTNSYNATGFGSGVTVTAQVRALDSTGAKTTSDYSVLVSATTTTSQTVFAITNSNFAENQSTATDGNNVPQPNPGARLFFSTDGPNVGVDGTNTYDGDVSLSLADGTFVASYTMGNGTVTATLPGTGSRSFFFTMGAAQRTNETGPVLANGISQLTFPAGTNNNLYKPSFDTKVVFLGDSITVLGGGQIASRYALAPYLRTGGRGVTMLSYGARRLGTAIYDDAAWASTRAQILSGVSGGSTRIFYCEAGTNDFGLGPYTAADLAAKLQTRLVDLHNADPTLRVVLQTILLTGYENYVNAQATGANQNTSTPPQWRTAFETIKTNLPWVILAKGQNMIPDDTYLQPDPNGFKVHPTFAGNQQYYFPNVASYFVGAGDSVTVAPRTPLTSYNEQFNSLANFNNLSSGSGSAGTNGGVLELLPGISNGQPQSNPAWVSCKDTFNMPGRRVYVKLLNPLNPNDTNAGTFVWIGVNVYNSANNIHISVQNNLVYTRFGDGRSLSSIGYNANTMVYFSHRVSADGSTCYLEYSADAINWTLLATMSISGIDYSSTNYNIYATQADLNTLQGPARLDNLILQAA